MVETQTAPITALTFPSDDAVFAERVRHILLGAHDDSVDQAIVRVTTGLRSLHPDVTVRLRSEIAGFGNLPVVYVFRDGGAVPRFIDEGWTGTAGAARVVTNRDWTYVEANEAAAALYGVPLQDILGKRAGTFTRQDQRADAQTLTHLLSSSGRLHSLSIVKRPDGTEVTVEFVTVLDAAGSGLDVTMLRPIEQLEDDGAS